MDPRISGKIKGTNYVLTDRVCVTLDRPPLDHYLCVHCAGPLSDTHWSIVDPQDAQILSQFIKSVI